MGPDELTDPLPAPLGRWMLRRMVAGAVRYGHEFSVLLIRGAAPDTLATVLRGADLLDSTTRQVHLQRLLGLPTPRYLHVPVATGPDGRKLSKSLGAVPLDAGNEASALWRALAFLGQDPPTPLQETGLDAVWRWAKENWDPDRIPRTRTIPV
jgi:glutamyl-Q tRNA(Asp) synthetase